MRISDCSSDVCSSDLTRNAPHLLILDEPTNHLDVDSREALVQALNSYSGAVVIVSHDRHMIELVADRLVLVDGGLAQEYNGTLEDYNDMVLAQGPSGTPTNADTKAERRDAAGAGERLLPVHYQQSGGEGTGVIGRRA